MFRRSFLLTVLQLAFMVQYYNELTALAHHRKRLRRSLPTTLKKIVDQMSKQAAHLTSFYSNFYQVSTSSPVNNIAPAVFTTEPSLVSIPFDPSEVRWKQSNIGALMRDFCMSKRSRLDNCLGRHHTNRVEFSTTTK
jgi:hypothetical protein